MLYLVLFYFIFSCLVLPCLLGGGALFEVPWSGRRDSGLLQVPLLLPQGQSVGLKDQ